jgi:predicted amidophosphoribosyltransferase
VIRHESSAMRNAAAANIAVVLATLIALIAPPRCPACAAPVPAGRRLCGPCQAALPWLGAGTCPRCALPAPCGPPCPARRAAFCAAWSPVAHEGPARALVHALKFRGRTAAADVMAAQIVANAPAGLLAGPALLVPAPTHPARRRERGFDQAQAIARRLGRRASLPVACVLARGGPVTTQVGSGRSARAASVTHSLRAAREVSGRVILVDDVHTTGATLDACARALRGAGAREVIAVAYARALG